MKGKRLYALALAAALTAAPFAAAEAEAAENSQTAETEAAENSRTAETETVVKSLSDEELSQLLGYVKEKWDAGEFSDREDILAAIAEGEEAFGVTIGDRVKDELASAIKALDSLGLNHDAVITMAERLYDEYGDALADNVMEIAEKELAGPVGEAIQDRIVEPAKEAAKAAVKDTAQHFWQDLKNSVISFFEGIFKK